MLYRDCSNDGTVHAKDLDVIKLAVKLLTRRQGSLPVVNGSLTKPAESGIQINSFHKQVGWTCTNLIIATLDIALDKRETWREHCLFASLQCSLLAFNWVFLNLNLFPPIRVH